MTPPSALSRRNTPLRLAPLAAACAALLAGCSVIPQAFDLTETLQGSRADRAALESEQQAAADAVTLEEAIARALKYNRDRRVSMMESVISTNALALSTFDMLPQLSARAGYTERDKLAASSSGVYDNGVVNRTTPPTYSVSAVTSGRNTNLAVSWNMLDFGLSYFRAGQTADRYLIAKERERKAVHNLIQDVRSAYWRAVSSQRLLAKLDPLLKRVDVALANSRQIETQRLRNPVDALTYQRDLLDVKRSLDSLQKDLLDARTTLITLMGLPPGTDLRLRDVENLRYTVPEMKFDLETLETTALAIRPELMESRYQTRITQADGRAALLALLPSATLTTGRSFDNNDYLLFNRWTEHGATLSLNLLNAFKAPQMVRQTRDQAALANERRLALSAAVLGQVHIARLGFEQAKQQFATASEYLSIVRRISEQMRQQRNAQSAGEMELIREELTEILSELRRDVAYAEVQNSYGRIFVTAGVNPLPDAVPDNTLPTLTQAVAQRLGEWDQGEVGLVIKPLSSQFKTWTGAGEQRFTFAADTFTVGGKVRYSVSQPGGRPLPAWLRFDPETRTFSGNPPAAAPSVELEVLAANDAGGRARDRFRLTLSQTNDLPVAEDPATQAVREGGEPISGRLIASDADGDALTFVLTQPRTVVPGFSFQPDGRWRFDPKDPAYQSLAEDEKRTVAVPIEVRDSQGATTSVTLRIDVIGRNNPPRWTTAPAPVQFAANAERAEGQLQFADLDNGARLTVSVEGGAPPAGFDLLPDGRWRFNLQQAEIVRLATGERRSLSIPLVVTDERGATARSTLALTVVGVNDAPRASDVTAPRLVLSPAGEYQAQVPADLFVDPEGRPLTYQVFHRAFLTPGPLPAWLTFDAARLRLSVAADQTLPTAGVRMTLVLTATDPEGASASRTLELEVEPRPPAKPAP